MTPEEKAKLMNIFYSKYKECENLGLKEEAQRYKSEYFRIKNWNELGFMKLDMGEKS